MNLHEAADVMLCMNLAAREDRRDAAWGEFARHELRVERIPAVDQRWVRCERGYDSRARYACGLSKRIALRAARPRCREGLLLLEDDVVFHPEFTARLADLTVPPDWAMLYLGCQHLTRPDVVSAGLVRVRRASSNHALLIRAGCLRQVLAAMKPGGTGRGAGGLASDMQIAELQKTLPVYAAWPNLAWQRGSPSSIEDPRNAGGYLADGSQRWCRHAIAGLEKDMEDLRAGQQSWCWHGGSKVWMHPDEWQAMLAYLKPGMRLLEWGSGGSTMALGGLVRELVSMEHDAGFADKLRPQLPANVHLLSVPQEWGDGKIGEAQPGQFASYIRRGTEQGVFDAMLVDGRARIECVLATLRAGVLREGGRVFIHDWPSRPRYHERWAELEPWLEEVEIIRHTRRGMGVFILKAGHSGNSLKRDPG